MKANPASRRLQLKLSEALGAAVKRAASRNGETVADLCRRAIAAELGSPEMAQVRGVGKPKGK